MQPADSSTVSEMIADGDFKQNGKVDQEEFLQMMRKRRPSMDAMDAPPQLG